MEERVAKEAVELDQGTEFGRRSADEEGGLEALPTKVVASHGGGFAPQALYITEGQGKKLYQNHAHRLLLGSAVGAAGGGGTLPARAANAPLAS